MDPAKLAKLQAQAAANRLGERSVTIAAFLHLAHNHHF